MGITIVRSLPEEEWRRFVEQQPGGNIFHTPEMFHVFNKSRGHRAEVWAATKNGRILVLLVPVQIKLADGLRRTLTTRAVAHGSVLCAPSIERSDALATLLRNYTHNVKGRPLFTELRNISDLSDIQPILNEHRFAYEDHLNYLIELNRPVQALFQSIGSRTRKNIRRGLKRGEVVVEEVKDRGQMAACYDILCQTYRAARVPLADRSLFEAAFEILSPKGMIRFTIARVAHTPVAVSVDLIYKDRIYGWYGGLNRSYRSFVPNELLMWHILEWGAENGYRLYDFGGAGKPDENYGVRDFKAKFGGILVCFGRNVFTHAPYLLRLSKLGYSLYRRLLKINHALQ